MIFLSFSSLILKYINGFCATHWELFATKNYFDDSGDFISTFVGFPMLVNSWIIVFGMFLNVLKVALFSKSENKTKRTKKE